MDRFIRSLFGLVIAALIVYAAGRCVSVERRLAAAEERLAGLQRECAQLRGDNAALERENVRRKETDAMGEIARDRLGMVLPEDRIYFVESEK